MRKQIQKMQQSQQVIKSLEDGKILDAIISLFQIWFMSSIIGGFFLTWCKNLSLYYHLIKNQRRMLIDIFDSYVKHVG